MPPRRPLLAHRNHRALTAVRLEQAAPPRDEATTPAAWPVTLSTTMSEHLIDTHFPGQQFPVGSVVTFLDRHRRTVFGTVTELRRHEAIVAAGETGRWRGVATVNAELGCLKDWS